MAPGTSILACLLLILVVGCGQKNGDSSMASMSHEPQIDVKAIEAELAKTRASDVKTLKAEESLAAGKPTEKPVEKQAPEKKVAEKKTAEKKVVGKKTAAKKVAEKKPEEKKPEKTWREFLTIPFVSKRVEEKNPEEKKAEAKKPEKKVAKAKPVAKPEQKKIAVDKRVIETADVPLVESSPEDHWATASQISARPGSHEFGPRLSAAAAAPAPRKPAAVSKKSSTEPKPAPAPAVSISGERYIVQAGAFRSKENAEKLAGKLSSAGFGIKVQSVDQDSASLHLVRVIETVGTMTEARQVVDKLKSAAHGVQAQIITAMPEPKP